MIDEARGELILMTEVLRDMEAIAARLSAAAKAAIKDKYGDYFPGPGLDRDFSSLVWMIGNDLRFLNERIKNRVESYPHLIEPAEEQIEETPVSRPEPADIGIGGGSR